MVRWLDRLQRRSRAGGFAIAVIYKYVDDQGGYLAALIT
jgi:membrane protein